MVKIILGKWQIKFGIMDSGIWGIILCPKYEDFYPRKTANEIWKFGFMNLDRYLLKKRFYK